MQKITPFLWFNDNVEEAMAFYTSVFKEAKAGNIIRFDMPGQPGKVLTATMELFGQTFTLLNGGPQFGFTEAVSFVVNCESQEEVDYYWDRLTADGGKESMCGWLKDKFGLSWQIVPTALPKLLADKDPVKAARVMQAMLQMRRINLPTLEKAYQEEEAGVS
jgi:predicted 3-demethylubiquinone-9 3-methyltransferase (glyoxalase superfamily)